MTKEQKGIILLGYTIVEALRNLINRLKVRWKRS
jgi:hypothetical protein